MHLIDQEERSRAGEPGDLADLAHEVAEILLWVAGVGHAGGDLDIELELHACWHCDAEGLHHAQGAIDTVLDPVPSTHLAQQPRRHPRESDAEVGLGPNLLNVGRDPACLDGEHVQLHQQHGLAHSTQARVDEAAVIAAGGEPLDQRLEVSRSPSRPARLGGLRPAPGVYGFSRFCRSGILGLSMDVSSLDRKPQTPVPTGGSLRADVSLAGARQASHLQN